MPRAQHAPVPLGKLVPLGAPGQLAPLGHVGKLGPLHAPRVLSPPSRDGDSLKRELYASGLLPPKSSAPRGAEEGGEGAGDEGGGDGNDDDAASEQGSSSHGGDGGGSEAASGSRHSSHHSSGGSGGHRAQGSPGGSSAHSSNQDREWWGAGAAVLAEVGGQRCARGLIACLARLVLSSLLFLVLRSSGSWVSRFPFPRSLDNWALRPSNPKVLKSQVLRSLRARHPQVLACQAILRSLRARHPQVLACQASSGPCVPGILRSLRARQSSGPCVPGNPQVLACQAWLILPQALAALTLPTLTDRACFKGSGRPRRGCCMARGKPGGRGAMC